MKVDLSKFNVDQQDMIKSELPLMVVAGPGSGKTHTLAYKILAHMDAGLDLDNIMILSFTKKAAGEIKERIERYGQIQIDEDKSYVGTFHSVFYKLLTGDKGYYTLVEPDDDLQLFYEKVIKRINIADNIPDTLTIKNVKELNKYFKSNYGVKFTTKDIHNYMSSLINAGTFNIGEIADQTQSKFEDVAGLRLAIAEYYMIKQKENSISYSDILRMTKEKLTKDPVFKTNIQLKFKEIYIDEFQDTNQIEFDIIKLMDIKQICAIGDPYQSIYGFLDARIDNVRDFEDYFKSNRVQLTYNYRSNKSIVAITNAITKHFKNPIQGLLPLVSKELVKDKKVQLVKTNNNAKEIHLQIAELIKSGVPPAEICVIMRKNTDSRKLESDLDNANIKYNKISGKTFYELPEIKVSTYMLLFSLDNSDLGVFRYLSNQYFGVGDITTSEMLNEMDKKGLTKVNLETLNQLSMDGKRKKALSDMLTVFAKYENKEMNLFNLLNLQDDLGIIERMVDAKETAQEKADLLENVEIFYQDIEYYENKPVYQIMNHLNRKLVAHVKTNSKDAKDAITLTSAHTAKGLEWGYVFVINVAKGEITESAMDQFKLTDEQLRLLYVIASRAKEGLVLVHQGVTLQDKARALCTIISKMLKNPNLEIILDHEAKALKALDKQGVFDLYGEDEMSDKNSDMER